MSNLNLSASFVPSDDELFSSLIGPSISVRFLRSLLKKRGILVANDIEKIELAKYVSSLHLSFLEHELIAQEYEKKRNHRDNSSGAWLETGLDLTTIENLIHNIKNDVAEEIKLSINNIKVSNENDKIRISTNYTKINPAKNAFARREIKEKSIIISKNIDGQYYVESPKDEDVDKIKNVFLAAIMEKDNTAKLVDINLMGMTNPLDRIEFFDLLMRRVEGLDYKNLVDVSVSRPKEDTEDDNEDQSKTEVATIKRADFKGKYLRESEQLKKFLDEGFHTFSIVWEVVKSGDAKNEPIKLEAKFSDAENCTGFSYCARGITLRGDDGKLKSNPQKLSNTEEERINISIYKSAMNIMDELYLRYSPPVVVLPSESE